MISTPSSLFLFCSLLLQFQRSMASEDLAGPGELGPGALNNLIWYTFPVSATFSCGTSGSVCGFYRDQYGQEPVPSIGVTETGEGSVWKAGSTEAFVTLRQCRNGRCVVYCFSDCECIEVGTGNECETTTAAPTPAPVTAPTPEPFICPEQEQTLLCPDLMTNNLPTTVPDCDCYNFCNGELNGCCNQESGTCGANECPNGERVMGCKMTDSRSSNTNGDDDDDNDGDGNQLSNAVVPRTLVGHIAVVFGALFALGL